MEKRGSRARIEPLNDRALSSDLERDRSLPCAPGLAARGSGRSSRSDLHIVVTGATGELGGAVAELLLARGAVCLLPVRSAAKLGAALERAHVVEGIDLADELAVEGFYRDLPEL